MHFTRLRLSGFKSFAEPAELLVEPGLTGIVGPNGCGKSNLVEALRWVMGETSAKKMRGEGMDDVIFNGSASRPPRGIAEVSVRLDNSDRRAPAGFNEFDDIEVVRRIERESGSAYAINGAEARTRDVQIMFADFSTGAHSTALVSQGQIGMLVQAKPAARRALIEEAAGVTGLHSRRHEAELRLRAADTNLERLADVVETLEAQLRGLKRQARQASRYGRLSGHIRAAEAQLFLRLWTDGLAEAQAAALALAAADEAVTAATGAAAKASASQLKAQETVPPLRQEEASRAAGLQRLTTERESLDAEETRAKAAANALGERITQIDADQERERELAAEAATKAANLEKERAEHEAAQAGEAPALQSSAEHLTAATATLGRGEERLDELTGRLTDAEAGRARLTAEIEQGARRTSEIEARLTEAEAERAQLTEADDPQMESAEVAAAAERVITADQRLTRAEDDLALCQREEATAGQACHEATSAHDRVAAEVAALAEIQAGDAGGWPALTEELTVTPGYEAALAAALGDDLAASTDPGAPVRWTETGGREGPPLPDGCQPLSDLVQAPAAVRLRLTQIGVVDEGDGETLRAKLAQGQRLVSRSGALWRWDGFTADPSAATPAAARLEQRNRLSTLQDQAQDLGRQLETASAALDAAATATAEAQQTREKARKAIKEAVTADAEFRESQTQAIRDAAARTERISALGELSEGLGREATALADRAAQAKSALREMPEPEALRREVAGARQALNGLRQAHREAESSHHQLAAEAGARAQRLDSIAAEHESWRQREAAGGRQLAQLRSRRSAAAAERKTLEAQPAAIAAKRQTLLSRTEQAEGERRAAADKLAVAEAELVQRDRQAKATQASLAVGREDRVRAEARTTQAERGEADLTARIAEQLECHPDALAALAGLEAGQQPPPATETQARLEKWKHERDNMGPVNLRAEAEAKELAEQLVALAGEREDLEAAIRRLRQGIASLNREGRQRMVQAFEAVDGHFQKLFQRLFGGGDARLKMVDSEDPLEAGLEIIATLPGKRPQTLSLLSGGEQALTAIALRFAVFMTNPAPICVLDEVDAPLDDANVGLFCGLVDEIAHLSETRFLVITHHPITMARMDRLYGVTMGERGVSQLVSVNLTRAETMREAS